MVNDTATELSLLPKAGTNTSANIKMAKCTDLVLSLFLTEEKTLANGKMESMLVNNYKKYFMYYIKTMKITVTAHD
jgi:hypothetical protein